MKVIVKSNFRKDIIKQHIPNIEEIKHLIELATKNNFKFFCQFTQCKKIRGYNNFYRIRLKNYRVGVEYKNNTIIFWRILPRKDIYKYFP